MQISQVQHLQVLSCHQISTCPMDLYLLICAVMLDLYLGYSNSAVGHI